MNLNILLIAPLLTALGIMEVNSLPLVRLVALIGAVRK